MTFMTSQQITSALAQPVPLIDGFNPKQVTTACYELALGHESCITSSSTQRERHETADLITIPPGQFGLLITQESVNIPPDVLALISIKSSQKMRGLVNISGFHVDPGFQGKLKFSVYNAGSSPVVLEVGQPLFPIWFCKLAGNDAKPYNGRHKGQTSISAEDVQRLQGKSASPEALALDVQKLYQRLRYVMIIGGVFIVSVALPIICSISVEVIKPKFMSDASSHDQKREPTSDVSHTQTQQPAPTPIPIPPAAPAPSKQAPDPIPPIAPVIAPTPNAAQPPLP